VNTPKTHDNSRVQRFLFGYLSAYELCSEYPQVEDIFSGVLGLKTEGVTSTRSMSRSTLFAILQQCPTISTAAVDEATSGNYAQRTVTAYAALARVTSQAIESFLGTLPPEELLGDTGEHRMLLDAPYLLALRNLEPA